MARPRQHAPWLKQHDNGVWYVQWYDAEKRRTQQLSLRTEDHREAQVALGKFIIGGREVYEDLTGENPSVTLCLDQYIAEHAMLNCADPHRQECAAANLKLFFTDIRMGDIDIAASRRYAKARMAGEIGVGSKRGRGSKAGAPSTIRRELNVLVAAANHARRWRRLAADKMPSVELPSHSRDKTPWYTRSELARLVAAAAPDPQLSRFIKIAYYTAARRFSLQRLKIDQISFEAKTIRLAQDGDKQTVKRRPIVPLYPVIKDDILFLWSEAGDDGFLFKNFDFYRPFRKLCESPEVGLAHKSHPHILRHTRATHLLLDGVSIYDVAKLLGDTVRTVESTYAHACSDHLAETTGRE